MNLRLIGSKSLMDDFKNSQVFEEEFSRSGGDDEILSSYHFWNFNFTKQNKKYRIHKYLLTKASSYFRKNIYYSESKTMKEATGETIEGNVVSGLIETFENFFIPYLYNEEVEIMIDNFMFVYMIADRWQFEEILNKCELFTIDEKNIINYVNVFLESRNCEFQTPGELQQKLFAFCVEQFDKIEKVDSFRRLRDAYYMCGIIEKTNHDVQLSLTDWINANYKLLYEAKEMFEKILDIITISELNVMSIYNVSKFLNMNVSDCLEVVVDKFMIIPEKEFKKFCYDDLYKVLEKEEREASEVQEKKFKVVSEFEETEVGEYEKNTEIIENTEDINQIIVIGEKVRFDIQEFKTDVFLKNSTSKNLVNIVKIVAKQRIKERSEKRMEKLWNNVTLNPINVSTWLEIAKSKFVSKPILENLPKRTGADVGTVYDPPEIFNLLKLTLHTNMKGSGVIINNPKKVTMTSDGNHYCARSSETFNINDVNIIVVKVDKVNCCGLVGIAHSINYSTFDQGFGSFQSYGDSLCTSGSTTCINSYCVVSKPIVNKGTIPYLNTGGIVTIITGEGTVSFFRNGELRGSLETDKSKGKEFFVLFDQDSSGEFSFIDDVSKEKIDSMLKILKDNDVLKKL